MLHEISSEVMSMSYQETWSLDFSDTLPLDFLGTMSNAPPCSTISFSDVCKKSQREICANVPKSKNGGNETRIEQSAKTRGD